MKLRISFAAIAALTALMLMQAELRAQDIPGIEICTVEKTMERRTSCLQSNINFQQKAIAKITADYQQRIDAAKAQIEALKATLASLQKTVDDLKSAQSKQGEGREQKAGG